jgi:hypothetical protein
MASYAAPPRPAGSAHPSRTLNAPSVVSTL